ncbi:MAG: hypothetical protein KF768_00025 [Phycisphaeraceae bacterium]|nr:hypothetical protein [Phycisphaeraceae bacterium]
MPVGRVWSYLPFASGTGPRGYFAGGVSPEGFLFRYEEAFSAGASELIFHMPFGKEDSGWPSYSYDAWSNLRRTKSAFLRDVRDQSKWVRLLERGYQTYGKIPWPYVGIPTDSTTEGHLHRMIWRSRSALAPWFRFGRKNKVEIPGVFIDNSGPRSATSAYWQARLALRQLGVPVVGCEPSAEPGTPWAKDADGKSLLTAQLWVNRIPYNPATQTGWFLGPAQLPHEIILFWYNWSGSGITDEAAWLSARLGEGYSVAVGTGWFVENNKTAQDLIDAA